MPQPLIWQNLKVSGQTPTPRSGHTLCTVGKLIILYGGLDNQKSKTGKSEPSKEIYVLRLGNNNTCEWSVKTASGDIPFPRTNHASCAIGADKMLIFGGYYSTNQRYNDTYILKTTNFSWSQPSNQKSGGEPKNTESKIGAPDPRANHTCTFMEGKVYVFGGHGGVLYQRKTFGDLLALDCETFEWTRKEPKGLGPEPRGGHTAAILPKNRILFYGGWSTTGQYSNMFIYDIANDSWIDAELSYNQPRWNHCGVMVQATPTWKYFVFGGSTGNFDEGTARNLGELSRDLFFLDVIDVEKNKMKWNEVKLESDENKPKARESSAMVYDAGESRLILFGGWNNNWLGDVLCIPVGIITGPPYAIFDIEPKIGPFTGHTTIRVFGEGFFNSQSISVKFIIGGKIVGGDGQQGNYVSDHEVTCLSPDVTAFGPREAEVRVSIEKMDATISSCKFQFFLNTKAENTLAYGPGILIDNPVGTDTVFYIQARDIENKNRKSGLDKFVIEAKKVGADPNDEASKVETTLEDMNNGTYAVKFHLKEEGEVKLTVNYKNEKDELKPIRGSPFIGKFSAKANPKNNELTGPGIAAYINEAITDIDQFISKGKENINIKNKNIQEDVLALLKVKENLIMIAGRKEKVVLEIDTLEQLINTLIELNIGKESDVKKVQKLAEEMKSMEKLSAGVEKDIATPVKAEGEKCKENIVKFEERLKNYSSELKKKAIYSYITVEQAFQIFETIKTEYDAFKKKADEFDYLSQMFEFPDIVAPVHKNLDQLKNEIQLVTAMWNHIKKCQAKFADYKERKWGDIVPVDLDDELKKLTRELGDIKNFDRKSGVFVGIRDDLKKWSTFIPLLIELKDPFMDVSDNRHWLEVQKTVNKPFKVEAAMPLVTVWELKLYEFKEAIEDITEKAKQEAKMEKALVKIDERWKEVVFEQYQFKKESNIQLLKMSDDNFEALEQDQVNIQNMSSNKYVGYFETIVNRWRESLANVFDVVGLLSEVQKTWSFLENLFMQSEEVMKELHNEAEKFRDIDRRVKHIIEDGSKVKNILKFCTQKDILKQLDQLQKELKECQKALDKFLNDKRKSYPRFYFVSVNDLLDILSNGNNPNKINVHMSKIFQAIDKLDLKDQGGQRPVAVGMHSSVGKEYVAFDRPLPLEGKVEGYLHSTIKKMISTLTSIASNSVKAYPTIDKDKWLEQDCSQVTILVNMIMWVFSVEEAFKAMAGGNLEAMKTALDKLKRGLENLIKRVQGDLDPGLRQKIMVLITMDTHSRDVMERLIREKVRKPEEFQWQSQLKFYWDPKKEDAKIAITDAVLWYGYEYLGNGPRLVITPLTDRIYVTATQALHLKMGCAPAGPAGTGKTESTKDLASAVGKACYVFNCSSEMNYESMGNIFKGLAASGCWGCFDEFNRLVPEVLSVCSVQFKSVTDAIKEKASRFLLQGDEIDLDPTCGVFITMNPGYLGRSELPEGLKSLFRPITVVVPDLELICENMLMAEGFIDAKILATKFTTLYALCRDLLSKAEHYDWGLRAIKSVLVVAGKFKRAEPNIKEQALLMRALRDFNMPKIVQQDLDIFHGLLGDLFPGVDIPRKVDLDFETIIKNVCVEDKLHPDPDFVLKVVQLKELLEIRHCVFVMGPPGSGKTKTWKTLSRSQDKGGQKTMWVDINPKTVSTRDLYGYIQTNKEWKDGLLSRIMRDLSNMPDQNPKWILLDGDLDANWIESMNSVMDDNKILTLASNERIFLKPHMRMIFEIRDLKFATPATVSRAGILYISDDKGSQWKSYVTSWINRNEDIANNEELKQNLHKLFEKYVEHALNFVFRNCKFLIPTSKMAMVVTICRALDGFLKEKILNLEFIFVYVCIWAIGGCLNGGGEADDFKKPFNAFWRGQTDWKVVRFPSSGTIFDFFIDQTGEQAKTEPWTKLLPNPPFEYDDISPMQTVTVPTPETIATSAFLKNLIFVGHPCLLIGLAGSGKTQLIKGLLREINAKFPERFLYQIINFNYYTESGPLQSMLEQTLEKKGGKAKGPKGKAKLIYFIDDLNMPALDKYNTQTAISLLRQLADYDHMYDIIKLTLLEIINTQTVAAMNPTAGSFSVDPRYQRHFWTCTVSMPETQSLNIIYSAFMNGHFKKFKPQIFENVANIIKAALALHTAVFERFKKTAINFHYEFNVRHLAGVFQGILMAQTNQFQEPEKLVKLWIHESERIYGDRLVTPADLAAYKALAGDIAKKNFGSRFNLNKYFTATNPENIIFCTFTQGTAGDNSYDLMQNDKLEHHIGEALKEYNDLYAAMDLVMFEDAMKHICKITRIVQQTSGHALLVGVGGSGKQSLSRLAAHISRLSFIQIVITQSYDMNALKTDLQAFYNRAAVKDEGLLWIFTDGQITNEKFLVYINDLLSSGEIADLYTQEEKENLINVVRPKVKNDGKVDTPDNCWTWFIDRIKQNLHMSLCFSPVGEAFRKRARQFPALVNTTVIDWFQPWPEDALLNVANKFLADTELGPQDVRTAVVKFMPESFKVVNNSCRLILEQERRYVYTTPKSFLELIKLFKNMVGKKRTDLEKDKERYETGLVKLRETAEMVKVMEEDLKVKQVDVEAKKVETDKVAVVVGAAKAKVEAESSKANAEAAKCADIQKRVEEQRISAQKDLDAAEPLVQQAESALKDINPKDFQQAKSFTSPPQGIPETFSGCINLLAGVAPNDMIEVDKNKKPKNTDWKACQKMMKDPKFFQEKLMELKGLINEGKIPAQNVNPVKPLLQEEWFTPEKMRNKSGAAAGICGFIINIILYYDVVVSVEPKRKALREATEQLEAANAKLAEINAIVANLQAELNKVQAEFDTVMAEKNAVVAEAQRLEDRLNLAKRLIKALGSEDARWEQSIRDLDKNLGVIVGDVLLSSAFVSYAGPFTKKYREELIKGSFLKFLKDNKVPMSPNPEPLVLLIDEAAKASWNNQGLPPDQVSTENGTILTYTERYPVMIDPQLQGITWIREKEKKNNLQVTRLGFKNIMNTMEQAIENGYSVLIENMGEKIDATLNPIIARNVIRKGNSKVKQIKIGDKTLTFNDKFRLFMHTKLANPHYPPEIQAEAALINFTVTEDGLGDQLLTLVVKKERPDLAKMKSELIQQQNEFKIKLKELEADLLFRLANAQGDILADVDLIINLETSKKISVEVAEKVIIAKATEADINIASEKYRQVADRGALIFFLMNELYKIHTFYMYSLEAFVVVVNRAIDSISEKKKKPEPKEGEGEAPKEGENKEEGEKKEEENQIEAAALTPRSLTKRVELLTEVITKYAFNYVRRGLFERHKLTVATMLTFRILIRRGNKELEGKDPKNVGELKNGLKEAEVSHLFLGRLHHQPGQVPDMLKSWIPDLMWSACLALQEYIPTHFEGFTQSLDADGLQWKKWFGVEKAEIEELPKNFKDLPAFYKLLLLRAMRPDRLPSALGLYVAKMMDEEYIQQAPFDIFQTYKETDKNTPIFFVLFPGVDPTPDVERVGAEVGITRANGKFVNISMGQGQEDIARDAIEKAAKEGTWIMLQNLHLMESWLKLFEGYLEKATAIAHSNFRCFVSSEPPPLPDMKIIPESILQNCIKIANEAPQDLKANLRRAYAKFDQGRIDKSSKQNEFKSILFALCMFHSLIVGRKKFGSQGWSRVYNFNDGDLTICADVLHNYLEKYEQVPYDDLRYLYGEIMYGGHITDNWDRRTCSTYLRVLIKPALLSRDFSLVLGFKSPEPHKFDYEAYKKYIEEKLPQESPLMYTMHPNAEISYLTALSETIFNTIIDVQGGVSKGGGSKKDDDTVIKLFEYRKGLDGKVFNLLDIRSRVKGVPTPYDVVSFQECERMNTLTAEICRSLDELKQGLDGALNMTDAMDNLSKSLGLNKVPDTWTAYAYPSKKPLSAWYADLQDRIKQLALWTAEMKIQKSIWIAGLFNPMSFLTAIMQVTSRAKLMPLDDMLLQTNVTAYKSPEELTNYAENGFFIHGLFLEGAAWELGGQGNEGYLIQAKLKELHPKMPIINVISVQKDLKKVKAQYQCPVYITSARGPTYVFTANLQMQDEEEEEEGAGSYEWILAGVAMLMSDD